jgi:hypothetical protein
VQPALRMAGDRVDYTTAAASNLSSGKAPHPNVLGSGVHSPSVGLVAGGWLRAQHDDGKRPGGCTGRHQIH